MIFRKKTQRTRGSGTFKLRGKIWHVIYYNSNGKRVSRSTETSDKSAANQILNKWIQEVHCVKIGLIDQSQHRIITQSKKPIADHIDDYIAHCNRKDQDPKHISQKRHQLQNWFQFSDIQHLQEITSESLELFLDARHKKGLSNRSWNQTIQIARAFVNWCVGDKRLASSSISHIPKKDERHNRKRIRRAISMKDVENLLAVARPTGREAWYALAVLLGLRKGDLQRLEWTDIKLEGHSPTITFRFDKSRRISHLPLNAALVDILNEHKAAQTPGTQFVFPTTVTDDTRDKDFARAGIQKINNKGEVADLHALRKTLGTNLARAGVPQESAKELMRHSSYRTTSDYYTDLDMTDLIKAMDAIPKIERSPSTVSVCETTIQLTNPTCTQICTQLACLTVHEGASVHTDSTEDVAFVQSNPLCGSSSVVERQPSKLHVASSSLVSRFRLRIWSRVLATVPHQALVKRAEKLFCCRQFKLAVQGAVFARQSTFGGLWIARVRRASLAKNFNRRALQKRVGENKINAV